MSYPCLHVRRRWDQKGRHPTACYNYRLRYLKYNVIIPYKVKKGTWGGAGTNKDFKNPSHAGPKTQELGPRSAEGSDRVGSEHNDLVV